LKNVTRRCCGICWKQLGKSREFSTGVTVDQYRERLILRRAVERSLEIIGEAARGVSDRFKAEHPEIPWRAITAQRHILAHEYGEIDDERIWRVAITHIPELVRQLQPLVPPPPKT
jgi:uncharacterized protein with HEPN domain